MAENNGDLSTAMVNRSFMHIIEVLQIYIFNIL